MSIRILASDFPVKSATIYKSSKAEVIRTFPLELKAGQNTVEIRGLPSAIDTHSVRVSGLGDARLFDVVCKLGNNNSTPYAPDSPAEIVRNLKAKKSVLESEKRIREHEANILVQYAKTITGEFVAPAQMAQFLQSFVEQGRKNTEAVSSIDEKIVEIDRSLEIEAEKLSLKKGTLTGEVHVAIGATAPESIQMQITYIVDHTSWEPTYELHATTENGKPSAKVYLHYRARVTQSTGEDWKDAAITLNTSSNDLSRKTIPKLQQIKIKPQPLWRSNTFGSNNGTSLYKNVLFGSSKASGPSTDAFAPMTMQHQAHPGAALFGQAPAAQSLFGSAPPPQPQHEPVQALPDESEEIFEEVVLPDGSTTSEASTLVTETPFAISYSVEGTSTIPSDGVEHQVAVAVLPFQSSTSYVTVPRIDPRLFLQCQVKNTSEYRLLPGPVQVILDNTYVSRTYIHDIVAGDTFDCTLGDDATAKVTYARTFKTTRSSGGAFTETINTITYTTKITVHNKHAFAIEDLIVKDVIPMCDDSRVKVVLRKPEVLASAKEGEILDVGSQGLKVGWEATVDGKGGEKEGKFEWKWRADAGAQVTMETQWDVKGPSDVTLVETSALGGFTQSFT
ncbi:uncharacterized protein EV420DRAFT_1742692 [Desarmillaria tabescens]|uniref:Mucoidy inhibitor A n=1 Tax=Armillaria tabescens TaxID=1929756 RepID=A0AA39TU93_ARMTA|nr:uncharacterized protein EV420DRAFT_1742692 [Desarmillaria tabescens]KAK0470322.1 hypothetical protein EV420DRAFT_1742692 [Desarmillaria tabescens]